MKLIDALRIIGEKDIKGDPVQFDLVYSDCNRTEITGGSIIEMKGVIKTGLPYNMKDNFMIGIKHPNSSKPPIPVHCRLITQINSEHISY